MVFANSCEGDASTINITLQKYVERTSKGGPMNDTYFVAASIIRWCVCFALVFIVAIPTVTSLVDPG
jgi:hypothetical protein